MGDPIVNQAIESLGTVAQAAKKLGVSKSLLYMIMRGKRKPNDDLLEKLGFRRVELITRAG
jgi:transcriptional regulator with XRE-family HTH domain